MKFFIITFDRKAGASYKEFHEQFVSSKIINGWFHYIKSSYIVGSNNSAKEISELFTETSKTNNLPTTHLVVEINMSNRQGMLTNDAWQWIRNNASKKPI
jgi:hypothetical protein